MGTSPRKEAVLLQEVGPRDGLQNEPVVLAPRARAELIDELANAGLSRIQIGSFVNPKRVPQMAGTDELWNRLNKNPGVRYSVLILNERGLDAAVKAGVPHVEIYVSASETHSLKNSNATVEQSLKTACRMLQRAHQTDITVTAGVMCAFGCHYEGTVSVERVIGIVRRFLEFDPAEIGLADTTGTADPHGMRTMINALEGTLEMNRLALHLHDTAGFGLANLRTALEMGVRRFDSSVGALGGCPFIPGAKGNISTERTVETVESLGFDTDVDLDAVSRVRARLGDLLGRQLQG